jgi:hypothetical protein
VAKEAQRMKYTYQVYWERLGKAGALEPLFPHPFTFEFATVAEAREIVQTLVDSGKLPAHSITLTSEDCSLSERYFQIDGSWRRRA